MNTHAATINVAPGEVDLNPGNGLCSLLEAVLNANRLNGDSSNGDCALGNPSGLDIVELAANNTYTLIDRFDTDSSGDSGLPRISTPVQINGNGAKIERSPTLFSNGDPCDSSTPFRIFRVMDSGRLILHKVTLQTGCAKKSLKGAGGAIFNMGTTEIYDSIIIDNAALRSGGAIHNDGTLTVERCRFTNNKVTSGAGGAITNTRVANFNDTTIDGNSSINAGAGGGIYNATYASQLALNNSTLSGNISEGTGGALQNLPGNTSLKNVTIARNQTNISSQEGAGIFTLNSVNLTNTLLVESFGGTNCEGAFALSGNNMDDDGTCGASTVNSTVIEDLANNGGPTPTHKLISASAAVNAGDNTSCLATDQRGFTRLGDCDLGAVELAGNTVDIVATDANKNEGNTNTTPFIFTVTRSGDTSLAASVDFTVTPSGSNPFGGDDIGSMATTGTVNFAPNSASETIAINVNGDLTVEPDETFLVTISNQINTELGAVTANGVIQNDDQATVTITAINADQPENDSGTTEFTFNASVDNPVQSGFSMDYTTIDGSATVANGDYNQSNGTLTFDGTPGQTFMISVDVNGDIVVEPDEMFSVTLNNPSNPDITGLPQAATIRNDDQATVTLFAANANQPEGDTGTTSYTFTATLDTPVQDGFNLAFNTNDGTATVADNDYLDNDGSLSFAGTANEAKTITVDVNGDFNLEQDEMFTVALGTTNISGINISNSPLSASIQNDDDSLGIGENNVPNKNDSGIGDGNGDGIEDSSQTNVSSISSSVAGCWFTVSNNQGYQQHNILTNDVSYVNDLYFPCKQVGFDIITPDNALIDVEVNMSFGGSIEPENYYKLNQVTNNWDSVATGIVEGNKVVYRFQVQDNGPYDADPAIGNFRDPSGSAMLVKAVPTLQPNILLLLAIMLPLLSAFKWKKTQ